MEPLQGQLGNSLNWVIRRNPTYLLSAVLMAVGARLLLVHPNDPTGDVWLIVVTLAVLQIYEWAVSAILAVLHRSNRSPEDKPTLLLVAAVFWTGPFAATLEMIALRPALGTYVAIGACVIALGEMRLCNRALDLRLSSAAQVVGCACVALLTTAAPLLKTPDSDSGVNELYLYAAWWALAGILLGCVAAIRSHRRRAAIDVQSMSASGNPCEILFLIITAAATAVHLIGMNYGFFCHAAYFYAAPALVAVAIVGFELVAPRIREKPWMLMPPLVLPAIAMLLALQPFDSRVPVEALPVWARDPLAGIALIAALAWWFGFARLRRSILLHAGNSALAVTAFAVARSQSILVPQLGMPPHLLALYALTGYLAIMALLRRSRAEAVLALAIHLLATARVLDGKTPADEIIICILGGWSALAGIHLAFRRPRPGLLAQPVIFLVTVPWLLDSASAFRFEIAIHSAVLLITLFAVGHFWPWTRYRSVVLLVASGHLACLAGYGAMQGEHPAAVMLVSAGFVLLIAGALVSWHKATLLKWAPATVVEVSSVPAERSPDDEAPSIDVPTTS